VEQAAAGVTAVDDETELQRQMAALGLPISFTASEVPGGDESGEENDEDGDGE